MASPCEILIETDDASHARFLLQQAAQETWRIEQKFSRYRQDNIIHRINSADGHEVVVDEETARLLDYAHTCHDISDGLFDITSGILRRVWKFDGSDNVPSQNAITPLLSLIGWDKISWNAPTLTLLPGMEIDLGGIGKEYAVDRVLSQLQQLTDSALLVNFGGDLHANQERANQQPWMTGIENPDQTDHALKMVEVHHGALATSGDARSFLLKEGKRFSHVLNPKTGWPVQQAAHSITVAAANCIDAGILSTLALLHGEQAETFLDAQEVKYWIIR